MKKNWLPIALILTFIIGWDLLVVRRYNQKVQGQAAATQSTAQNTATATTATSSGTAIATTTNKVQLGEVGSKEWEAARTLTLANQTQARVFPGAAIGAIDLEHYFVRGTKPARTQQIRLLPGAFHWVSDNSSVAACLSALQAGANNNFSAHVGAISCEVNYVPDARAAGLVNTTLKISGVPGNPGTASGFVELRAREALGNVPEPDQHYLAYKQNGETKRVRGKKLLAETVTSAGRVEWFSWSDKYFASILLPKGNFNPDIVYGPAALTSTEGKPVEKTAEFAVRYPLFAGSTAPSVYEFDIYFGPLDQVTLETLHPGMTEVIDFGWMSLVAKSMVWLLKIINALFRNFGVSIIVLTMMVRLAFWPLNKKAFQSAQKMKTVQPLVKALQDKYGKDPAKREQLNLEMMSLYKREKVNPVGSCLPLLLQMPVFIGLYAALNHSLDLYQAPFLGWITDLSSRDPYFIFPALWTVSLFVYVLLNPQTMSPQPGMPDMRWMTYGMNFFIGYLSKDWPAGLTLYLFVSNLVGIAQQLAMRRGDKLQPVQEGV